MNKPIRLLIYITVYLLLMLSITGCWSRREGDELSIVMAVGLDQPEQNGNVQFTAQIFKPKKQEEGGMGGGGGGGGEAYWNVKSTGDTVSTAVQGAVHRVPRDLYFAHNQIVIFSRRIAEEGIQPYIDFFMREHQNRLSIWILVAKENAHEILDIPPHLEDLPALDIVDLIEDQVEASQTSVVNLKQVATRLLSKTTATIAPLVEVSGEGAEQTVRLSGTAVFKRDKLAGQLNQYETRGLLWVINEVKRGIIEVDCPGGGGKAALFINKANSKIVPEVKGTRLKMKIDIREDGILESQSCPENLALPPIVSELEKRKADAIRNEVMAAIKKSRKLHTDIFGFGDAVHQAYPKQWKALEGKWDKVFPDIEIELNVNANIYRSGRATLPLVPAKE